MMVMIMMCVVMCGLFRIGAAFGLERPFDERDLATELAGHLFNHLIAANADAIGKNLHWQMAIAQMPGHARKITRLSHADFCQRFGRSDNFNQATIFQHQGITMPQHHGFRQVEQKFETLYAFHCHAATMALIEIQHNRVSRCCLPRATRADEIGSHHGSTSSAQHFDTRWRDGFNARHLSRTLRHDTQQLLRMGAL
jgi:hypothetical protein